MAQYIPTDTLFGLQWYLQNTGQSGSGPGDIDLDITSVWPDYTGKGVNVAVYDNGVDFNQVDLKDNYDHSLDVIIDGTPSDAFYLQPSQVGGTTGYNAVNAHATTLSGIIAAENNGVGTVGVAFDASIVGVYAPITGVRGNTTPNSQMIQAMQQLKNFDVADFAGGGSQFLDGQASPNLASFYTAIQSAASDGRGGLGTILVNAMHNSGPGFGGFDGNGSGFDANRFYIHVGGILDTGYVAPYTTRGANMLVSAFTGPPGTPGDPRGIETTDISGADGINSGDYASSNGTSVASPQIAGIAALMLQANPDLGWRDVQNIFSQSARHTGSDIGAPLNASETDPWEFNGGNNWNGGGRHYSIDYGYGIADAHDAVRMAETWGITGTAAATSANQTVKTVALTPGNLAIPDNTGSSVTLHFNVSDDIRLENVRLNLGVTHARIQDLTITLISPDGTTSNIFDPVSSEAGTGNSVTSWSFDSEEFRGELSPGDWQAVITDHVSGNTGTIGNSNLQLFGSSNITSTRYVYTDEFHSYADIAGRSTLTDTDGGSDTINAAAVTSASHIDLNQMASSMIDHHALTITAGSDIENAIGGDGDDTLIGNALDNILVGGRGTNTIDGGAGDDTAAFLNNYATYTLQRSGSTIVVTGAESSDTLTSIEHLKFADVTFDARNIFAPQITSDGGGDTSTLAVKEHQTAVTTVVATDADPGTTLAYAISGGADASLFTIDASTGVLNFANAPDFASPTDSDHNNSYIVAVSASDGSFTDTQILTVNVTDGSAGTDAPDVITGSALADNINGGGGDDHIVGGGGDDLLGGGPGDDQVTGGDGNDTLWGEDGNDVLGGNAGNDTIIGGDGNDIVGGDDGNDVLNGGDGNDTIFGGAGDDQLSGGSGDDTIVGDDGNDTIWGNDGNDTINAGAGNDLVLGGNGNDQIGGGAGDDDLRGEAGNDVLWGEDGNDMLEGGPGDDILVGGAGSDTFVFSAGDGHDIITDFTTSGPETDHIWLAGTDLHSFADVLAHATFDPATGATTITHNGTDTIVLNGVQLSALNAANFLFS